MLVLIVAEQVNSSHLLCGRLIESPLRDTPFCHEASDPVLYSGILLRAGLRVQCALCPLYVYHNVKEELSLQAVVRVPGSPVGLGGAPVGGKQAE